MALSRYEILRSAFGDAIADRRQAAADNELCAPDHAQSMQAQADKWTKLRDALLPLNIMESRLSFEALRALNTDDHGSLCDVLYFAAIARLSLIDAQEGTGTSVTADRQYRQRYLNLLSALSQPAEERSFISAPIRDVVAMVPEENWEDAGDGGKVFRPKLPQ